MSFKLTYATMFNPPAQMHERFEAAAASTRAGVGAQHALFIDGQDVPARNNFIKTTPVDGSPLGRFPAADAAEVNAAVAAAKRAFPAWRATPLAERVRLMKAVAALIELDLAEHGDLDATLVPTREEPLALLGAGARPLVVS